MPLLNVENSKKSWLYSWHWLISITNVGHLDSKHRGFFKFVYLQLKKQSKSRNRCCINDQINDQWSKPLCGKLNSCLWIHVRPIAGALYLLKRVDVYTKLYLATNMANLGLLITGKTKRFWILKLTPTVNINMFNTLFMFLDNEAKSPGKI